LSLKKKRKSEEDRGDGGGPAGTRSTVAAKLGHQKLSRAACHLRGESNKKEENPSRRRDQGNYTREAPWPGIWGKESCMRGLLGFALEGLQRKVLKQKKECKFVKRKGRGAKKSVTGVLWVPSHKKKGKGPFYLLHNGKR